MSDAWHRYFPRTSLDPRPDFHRVSAEWFALFLEQMEELPLHPVEKHQSLVFRLLCLPTWARACAIQLESVGLTWRLIGKELNGQAGFDLGRIIRRENRLLSCEESARVHGLMEYLRFWSLAGRDSTGEDVFDGTTYVLEGARNGQYHVVWRAEPEWGDTFGEFCDLLILLAGFSPR